MESGSSFVTRRTNRILATALVALVTLPGAAVAGPPDLVSDPPQNVRVVVYDVGGEDRLIVRFDSFIHNLLGPGVGPVEILAKAPMTANGNTYDDTKPTTEVFQKVDGVTTPIPGEMVYSLGPDDANFDSHNHWHLQRAAEYSIVNLDDTPAAPGAKVGFCMLDIDRPDDGAPVAQFGGSSQSLCWPRDLSGTGKPDTIRMGITPGWRDVYDYRLAHQWVDVTDLLPGQYKLRSVVDPDDIVVETEEDNGVGDQPITLPGYVPLPAARSIGHDAPSVTFALEATEVGDASDVPEFRVTEAPDHGTLTLGGDWQTDPVVTYTPAAGSTAADSFSYAVRERGSPFPSAPTQATVAIARGEAPSIAIGSVPGQMVTGTSVQLTATAPARWSASAGSITPTGGHFTAPSSVPPGGMVTITAISDEQAVDRVNVRIVPPPANEPLPLPPDAPPGEPLRATPPDPLAPAVPRPRRLRPGIGKVGAARIRHFVSVSAIAGQAGRLTISLRKGSKRIKGCVMEARAGASHTCRIRRPRDERSSLKVVVALRKRAGGTVTKTVTVAAPKRASASAHRH
jgi:hypothetical protein